MDIKKHPKRMKDKYNPYTLQIDDGKYILSFVDGEGNNHIMEIDENLYQLFNSFELEDLSQMVKMSRHYEHSELTESALNMRALIQPENMDQLVVNNLMFKEVMKVIFSLPNKQAERIILYYLYGYSYTEIANMERCEVSTITRSIKKGFVKIRSTFET